MILEIFFKDPDPWPKDPGSVGSGLKTHGSPTLLIIIYLFGDYIVIVSDMIF